MSKTIIDNEEWIHACIGHHVLSLQNFLKSEGFNLKILVGVCGIDEPEHRIGGNISAEDMPGLLRFLADKQEEKNKGETNE